MWHVREYNKTDKHARTQTREREGTHTEVEECRKVKDTALSNHPVTKPVTGGASLLIKAIT